mmetsp:Transcript_60209/g.111619  ORF Transcript_60209/g.111619 Transcript_60209/m.111619 type:complete len:326 (-) Transcript_60209:48-1025(-)
MGERLLLDIAQLHVQQVKAAQAVEARQRRPSGSVTAGSTAAASSSSSAAVATTLPMQLPGVRRDLTDIFREARQRKQDKIKSVYSGGYIEWFEQIRANKDEAGFKQFLDATSRQDMEPGKCRRCRTRVAVQANPQANVRRMRFCQVCAWKHCHQCCGKVVDISEVCELKSTRQGFTLVCCSSCTRYIGKLHWIQNSPPQGLAPLSAELFRHHWEIHAARKALLPALDLFDEHMSSVERRSGRQPREVVDGVRIRCDRLKQQIEMIEAAAESLDKLRSLVPDAQSRQGTVHAALLRHVKAVLVSLKARVTMATLRAQKWLDKVRIR